MARHRFQASRFHDEKWCKSSSSSIISRKNVLDHVCISCNLQVQGCQLAIAAYIFLQPYPVLQESSLCAICAFIASESWAFSPYQVLGWQHLHVAALHILRGLHTTCFGCLSCKRLCSECLLLSRLINSRLVCTASDGVPSLSPLYHVILVGVATTYARRNKNDIFMLRVITGLAAVVCHRVRMKLPQTSIRMQRAMLLYIACMSIHCDVQM